MMRLYIAGPMTHIPQFNFPEFDRVANLLRSQSIEVVNPAELDDPKSRAAALQSLDGDPEEYHRLTGLSWADFLSRDVKLIADGGFHGIICLPGWDRSRGARLETFVGYLNNVPLWEWNEAEGGLDGIEPVRLASAWTGIDMWQAVG